MVITDIMGSILFLTGTAILGMVLNRIIRLELTLACLLSGFLAGLSLPYLGIDTGLRADIIHDLVFYVILPVLIFEASWNLKPAYLKRWILPIFVLATAGVLISCLIIAVGAYFGINHPAFPWVSALLTGAILSATDPIAALSALKRAGAPEDLRTLVEGESLFNGAITVVLFGVVLAAATATITTSEDIGILNLFSTVFFGGIVFGWVMGLVGAIVALLLNNRSASNITLVFLAFISFYLSEHILHVSGIMSVMTAAIVSRVLLKEHEGSLLSDTLATWNWLGLFFNAMIFVLMGLVIDLNSLSNQWIAILIAIAFTLLARAVVIYGMGRISQRYSTRPVPKGWQYIMFWGGLKGGIAIVLALSLPRTLDSWYTVQSMVFGVVLFTLLVQGTTVGRLVRKHGQQDIP